MIWGKFIVSRLVDEILTELDPFEHTTIQAA